MTQLQRREFLKKSALWGVLTPGLSLSTGYMQAMERTPMASAPSDLKIFNITCGFIRGGNSVFVKIDTNQGVYGLGEGVDASVGSYHSVQRFKRMLQDKNPLNVHQLFEELRRAGVFGGAQAGMYVANLSAVESALWDLAGKALGLPVYQLLGGKFRDKIRVYCDTALYQNNLPTPADFAENAKMAKDMGFNAIKFDLDQRNDPRKYDQYNWTASPGELERMYQQIAAAREAVGPYIDICADMHGRYDTTTGERIAKMLEPLNLMWLEEPLFLLPQNMDVEAQKKQEYFSDTVVPFMKLHEPYPTTLKKVLQPGEKYLVNVSYLSPKNSDFGPGQLAVISNRHHFSFASIPDNIVTSLMEGEESSNVFLGLNFSILTDSLYGFKLVPMGKISYGEK